MGPQCSVTGRFNFAKKGKEIAVEESKKIEAMEKAADHRTIFPLLLTFIHRYSEVHCRNLRYNPFRDGENTYAANMVYQRLHRKAGNWRYQCTSKSILRVYQRKEIFLGWAGKQGME